MSLVLTTPPAAPVLTLDEAKLHLRVDVDDDDTLIDALIEVARQRLDGADGILGRALITQEWDYYLDAFPFHVRRDYQDLRGPYLPAASLGGCAKAIELPLAPLQSVDAVTYIDENGDEQTLDPTLYQVDKFSKPARIKPAEGQTWPATARVMNAVKISGTYGDGDDADAVPKPIRQAMLLIIGHYYDNREAVNIMTVAEELPMGVKALLAPYFLPAF